MRVIAAFRSSTDVWFLDYDEEFSSSCFNDFDQQPQDEEQREGAIFRKLNVFTAVTNSAINVDRLLQSCTTAKGNSCAVRKLDGVVYLAISDVYTEHFLAQLLLTLRDLLYMFGFSQITRVHKQQWRYVGQLLRTAERLMSNETVFLFQGIEHVSNNRSMFMKMLPEALAKVPSKTWGSHMLLLMGDKLLASWSRPGLPEMRPREMFILNIIFQDMLASLPSVPLAAAAAPPEPEFQTPTTGRRNMIRTALFSARQEHDAGQSPVYSQAPSPAPGAADRHEEDMGTPLPMSSPFSPDATAGLPSVPEGAVAEISVAESTPRPRRYSTMDDMHEARSNYSSSYTSQAADQDHPPSGERSADPEMPFVRRTYPDRLLYLRTAAGIHLPFTLHTVELQPNVAVMVLTEGEHLGVCETLQGALRGVYRMLEVIAEELDDSNRQQALSNHRELYCMAIRGSANQAAADAQINGDYTPLEQPVNGRIAYERTSKDLYLFFHSLTKAWCIGPELGNSNLAYGMVEAEVHTPDLIEKAWQTYDFDLEKYVDDKGLKIRCVRKDGWIRNRDGRWAQLSSGNFYCGGPAVCSCGTCNGECGPLDGCNCASCKPLAGTSGFGESEFKMTQSQRMRDRRVDDMKRLFEKTKDFSMQLLVKLDKLIPADQHRRLNMCLKHVSSAFAAGARFWTQMDSSVEDLLKYLREIVGSMIFTANQRDNNPQSPENMHVLQTELESKLEVFEDFFPMKLDCNVPPTFYLEQFPTLVFALYANRFTEVIKTMTLKPTSDKPRALTPAHPLTIKELVWSLYARATRCLSQGYTTMLLRSGDFIFAYFCWFEDPTGLRLTPADPKPLTSASDTGFIHKDIVSAWFPQARPGSVMCYEVYAIYLSLVPLDFVAIECQKLVRLMRDSDA